MLWFVVLVDLATHFPSPFSPSLLQPGTGLLTLITTPEGTIIDDCIVSRAKEVSEV